MGDAIQLASQWGPMGLLVAYLIYHDQARARQRTADKRERIAVDKETNMERAALTTALTMLTAVIQAGRNHA